MNRNVLTTDFAILGAGGWARRAELLSQRKSLSAVGRVNGRQRW
jgi:hypothetical protein